MIRRDLLTILPPAALALSGVATAAPATTNPDAELIALCAQFEALGRKIDAAFASVSGDHCSIAEQEAVNALHALILDVQAPIVAAITACTPVTLEGFVGLANVAVSANSQLTGGGLEDCYYSDRVLRVLLRGLTGRAGV